MLNFFAMILSDYESDASVPPGDLDAARRFLEWASADFAAHPVSSVQVEVGRVLIARAAPREDSELPVGRPFQQPDFTPVMFSPQTLSYGHPTSVRGTVSAFGP